MVKGQVDRPGCELRSTCTQPEALNRSCGLLPVGHDGDHCRAISERRGNILRNMKKAIRKLDNMPMCEQWDTWQTFNNTPGPYRFGFYQPRTKPWARDRVKSCELIASVLVKNCDCIRKNGLQDQCRRLACGGRAWCLDEPFPNCPPFTNRPSHPCPLDHKTNPYDKCGRQLVSVPCWPKSGGLDKPGEDYTADCFMK